MNAQKVLAVLFVIIDGIHDYPISVWTDFTGNLESLIAGLNRDEKLELVNKLHQLNLPLGSCQWYRRLNLCIKIHELI